MGRILAIDYGGRRTGLAATDTLQIIANPLATVESKRLIPYVTEYAAREPVDLIVVGLPTQTNGQESDNLHAARCMAGQLRKALPDVPLVWWDERYTSVMAQRAILDSGKGRKARRDKALVDEVAACIILQGYMDSRQYRSQ